MTDTFFPPATPVAKIETRSCPFDGSNGLGVNVSELRTIASPRPSPDTVNKPGAAVEIFAYAFEDNPSEFVTTNSADPFDNPFGTTNTTSSGAA